MLIKVTVLSQVVRELKGISKANKPYAMNFQTAWAHLFDKTGEANPFPEKFDLVLENDEHSKLPKIYPNGEYLLHPASMFMGQYGLEVAPKLSPMPKKQ